MKHFPCWIGTGCLVSMMLLIVSCGSANKPTENAPSVDPANQTTASKSSTPMTQRTKPVFNLDNNSKLSMIKGENPPVTSASECERIEQHACLNSATCVLEQNDKQYVCRASQNRCEVDFIQTDGEAETSCTAKQNCQFVRASCFCPKGIQCICGGGNPPMCQLSNQSDM